jgi:aryl-alcohol dehydrogenase-like predicted oxidoreductase
MEMVDHDLGLEPDGVVVGKALAGGRRGNTIIATKVGLEWRDGKVFRNSSPERLRTELEDSLRRLRTDVIDIYQVHWPDRVHL